MKKIFILIVSLGLLYPDRPFAQNSIKLYPYQMPPSHHPDYQRHHVKSRMPLSLITKFSL